MSFSYLSSAPGSSDRSWVRMRLGDTSSGSNEFEDEEIDALLDDEGSKLGALAASAETLGAKYARRADRTIGKLRIVYSRASERFFTVADRARKEVVLDGVSVAAGGISKAAVRSAKADTDRVEPFFERGQFDTPGTAASDSTDD